MKRYLILTLFFLVTSGLIFSQSEAVSDSLLETPFKKGTNLVGISGFVSSSDLGESGVFANSVQIGNTYRFEVRLGKFVADKNVVGLLFHTNKVNLAGTIESLSDLTSIGPFYRAYLGKKSDFGLILQASVLWANYVSSSIGLVGFNQINQYTQAQGVVGALGIGVAYVMAKRVTFEVTSEYSYASFQGVLSDHVMGSESDIILSISGLKFSFGFTVLFGKLKQHD